MNDIKTQAAEEMGLSKYEILAKDMKMDAKYLTRNQERTQQIRMVGTEEM